MIDELMKFNKEFVENKQYEKYIAGKYPDKKIAILSCMDARLTELLPAALGLKNGDVKIIKNAGGVISSPVGSVMRSLVVAIYTLGVEEILVIGHYDCGMQNLDVNEIIKKMENRGVSEEKIEFMKYCGVDFDKWLSGFECVEESVSETVKFIKNHPLIPSDIHVDGLIMDPTTGKVDRI
ncbi:beta-class carbonic anhydrase [Clostridium aminobutyricum]|uniref:carbonic anhydrase n=1 Tax=Clostridium aminobutyricum TaxID=33953 RepID=A0A939DA22_CLOAM|nr:carbonic anhydrase [Clostridium aminobutyricum]MBN7773987.1 carbonic anhydrase [Clostridium aminobutyricum]